MKKFASFVALSCALFTWSQDHHHEQLSRELQTQGVCGNNIERDRAFAADPQLKVQYDIDQANFEHQYQQYLQEYDPYERSTYVVPVVVHIVHEGGPENISNEQVYEAIERLNEDFNKQNDDTINTVPAFAGIIGNTNFEFRLATKAPDGSCHFGITRTYMPGGGAHDTGDNGDIRDAIQAQHGTWPQNKYMNIIVVKSIAGSAAYTNTPGNWYSASGMGGSIYMGHTVMGTIGTSSFSSRHILSHEVGHWFNLSHVWGSNNNAGEAGSCSTDDGVADTPNTIGWLFVCDLDGETCGSLDNVQNIMDYAGSCRTMFTAGQSARMQTAINSSTAQRNNLWQTSNLVATGTLNPGVLCEAQFSSNTQTVCAGQSVDFTDDSYHSVTGWNWSFAGGSPAISTAATPTVTYSTPGVYSVSLNVTDGSNNQTVTKSNYIVVLSEQGESIPYHEGFEAISSIPDNDNWVEVDYSGANSWTLATNAGSEGTSKSAKLGNFGNEDGSKDELISGTIDLSGVSPSDPMYFSFDYAYRKRLSSNDEWLRVYISKDCGETWVLRKNIHGSDLSSQINNNSYLPTSPEEWVHVEVTNIGSDYYVSNFRFMFQFENDGGNNIYIDNINLYPSSMSAIDEHGSEDMLRVYPNPANGLVNIQMNAIAGQNYAVKLYSSMGQLVDVVYEGEMTNGVNKLDYNTTNLAKGVYVIKIESEGRLQTIKLIKE